MTPREALTFAQQAIAQAVTHLPEEDAAGAPLDPKMCPQCGKRGRVKDARTSTGIAGGFRRRYACSCGARWSTREVIHMFQPGSLGRPIKGGALRID